MTPATDRTRALGRASSGPDAGVVGAGTMGTGIAQLFLQAGESVVLIDPSEPALERATASLGRLLERLEARGRLPEPAAALIARLTTSTELSAASPARWVVEAAPEDIDLKRDLFARLERTAPDALLATNTSTLSVTAIASACQRPERIVGLHFFNPPGLMRLVEVVPGFRTAPAVVERAVALARRLGREPVVAKDSPGFIVNRLARPFYLEALRLHAEGLDVELIDAAARGAGFRMGPFELLDLIGIDVNLAASESVYRAFYEEERFRPHPIQRAMVEAGLLGRKTGKGFYDHGEAAARDLQTARATASGPDEARVAGPNGPVPDVCVLGEGGLAKHLRAALRTVDPTTEGALALDTRLESHAVKGGADGTARPPRLLEERAVLLWGGSAGAAGAALGFSHVPRPDPLERPCIELTEAGLLPGEAPSPRVHLAAAALREAGADVVIVPDVPGGVAFRLVSRLCDEGARALAEGLAPAADIDLAMRLGLNYPAGPLEWADAIGAVELVGAMRLLATETMEGRFAPCHRMVSAALRGTALAAQRGAARRTFGQTGEGDRAGGPGDGPAREGWRG